MKRYLILSLFFLFVVSMPVVVKAQEVVRPTKTRFRVAGWYVADADFKNGGSSSVAVGQTSFKVAGFSFAYENRHYTWDDVSELPFGDGSDDPWSNLHRLSAGWEFKGKIDQDWGYLGGVTLTSAFEEESDDAHGMALRGGASYKFSENLTGVLGLRVFKNQIRTSLMPFLGLNYEQFEKDGTGMFINFGAPSTEIGYVASPASTFRFAYNIDGRTYRLRNDSSVIERGYVETSTMKMGAYYDWKPTKLFHMSVGPEYSFERNLKLYDDDGDRFGDKIKQDEAYGVRLEASISF